MHRSEIEIPEPVASTRQVGRIQVVKVENKGKGFRRLRIRIDG